MAHHLIRQAAADIHNAYASAHPSQPHKDTLKKISDELAEHIAALPGDAPAEEPAPTAPAAGAEA